MEVTSPLDAVGKSYGLKFLSLLLLIFVLTGVVGASIYATVDARITAETEQRLTVTAKGEADQLDNWFDLTEQQLDAVTRTTAVRSGDRYRTKSRLVRISARDAIAGTHLFDASTGEVTVQSGDGVVTSDGTLTTTAATRVERELADSGGSVTYTEPFRAADGTPVLLAVAKTQSRDGRAVISVVDLEALSAQILGDQEETAGGHSLSVITRDGTIALSSNASRILTRDSASDQVNVSGSGFYTNASGGETAVGYAAVDDRPLAVTNRVPTERAYSLRNAVSRQILALLGVLFVGLSTVGITIGRSTRATLTDLERRAETLSDGDLDAPIETSRRDEFGSVYAALDEMRRSLRSKIDELEAERRRVESARSAAEQARADAEAAHEDAAALAERLERRSEAFGDVMERAAAGDLTRRLDEDQEDAAMESIATAFNEMVVQLEGTVAEIRDFATDVDAASDQVETGATEIRDASEQVSRSTDAIFAAASDQHENLDSVANETTELADAVEAVAGTSDEVADLSRRAADRGEAGRDLASESVATMRRVDRKTDRAVHEIETLDAEIERIGEITVLIDEIAERTDVLALNASIEAAHASDSTDGFGVVAEEIKRLAGEVQEATQEIESVVADVRSSSDDAETEIREMRRLVDDGTETITAGMRELEDVLDLVEAVDEEIQSISDATDEQAASTQRVAATIEDVTDLSEQTRVDAGDVAAAAEEQTATVRAITERAQSLNERVSGLQTTVDAFDLSVGEHAESRDSIGTPVSEETTRKDVTAGRTAEDEEAPDERRDSGSPSTQPSLPATTSPTAPSTSHAAVDDESEPGGSGAE